MRPDQVDKIRAGIERAVTMVAGDVVVWVAPDNTQTTLLTIKEDPSSGTPEGLEIDQAGMRLGATKDLTFLKSYLAAQNVTLDVTGHFLILGERYDFVEDEPFKTDLVPLAGIQNIVTVRVRKAVESAQSTGGSEFVFDTADG